MDEWGLPDKYVCRELELTDKLYCRRNDVIQSRIGVAIDTFNKAVAAGVIEPVILPGEKYPRYYTAQVLHVFVLSSNGSVS